MGSFIATLTAAFLLVASGKANDLREQIKQAEETGAKARSLVAQQGLKTFWSPDGATFIYSDNNSDYTSVVLASGTKTVTPENKALALSFQKPVEILAPEELRKINSRTGDPMLLTIENGTSEPIEFLWSNDGELTSYGSIPPGDHRKQNTYEGHAWLIKDAAGSPLAGFVANVASPVVNISGKVATVHKPSPDQSPDGQWRASIKDHNLSITAVGKNETIALTTDGSAENGYRAPFHWSPDSKKLVGWKCADVPVRKIRIVQSTPPDQFQPKLLTIDYAKPGDPIEQPKPVLFDIATRQSIAIDDRLFPNPWKISELAWSQDSTRFSFVYNQRGHQCLRFITADTATGVPHLLFEETSATFIDYSQKFFLKRLPETHELIWASERSGHNHLYLIDEFTGALKNPITQGNFEVREVIQIDESKRQIVFKYLGFPDQDPYHIHFGRVDFDGKNFTRLTAGDGDHRVTFSPDQRWLIDTWSRVDQPPIVELRNATDGSLLTELKRVDDAALLKTGWTRPERFTAKGRDRLTDIHGIIIRPSHFDPSKKYPVLEDIYAGPHDHFVPKSYAAWSRLNTMAELGFIIVKIDGMGTNWRGTAFHDVAWKNLKDAGFPDRIPWIKAAAATRPWMDLSRLGIYGGSAGGQSAMAALLDHGDFYRAAVADCGCHDNRMDKIWWNEAWMGWPVDESYAENSNAARARKLTGKLLLIVGEIDRNVDPASTTQVVAALQKADKDFEYLPILNTGHGAAETAYGNYRRAEFLTRVLEANR